jgi:spermidine/putrescine-binding protein
MINAGVYQTLDRTKLTGWANLDPAILTVLEGWGAGVQHSVHQTP